MKIFEYCRIFLLALVFLIMLDGLVIGFFLSDFYARELVDVAKIENGVIKPLWLIIALVYILISFSLTYVIIHSEESSEALVFLKGAGLGIVVYGVYPDPRTTGGIGDFHFGCVADCGGGSRKPNL